MRKILLSAVIIGFTLYCAQPVLYAQSKFSFPRPNTLKTGSRPNIPKEKEITLNEPIELDFKTKAEIFEIRRQYVNEYRQLVSGQYTPYNTVFGAITDNKPWWGINGQFCSGPGKRSIDGPSEESRFFANPFLLLGLDEGRTFIFPESASCTPAYPRPTSLYWYAREAKAVVTYDLSRFFAERATQPQSAGMDYHVLSLENYNARDFGYSFVYAAPELSNGVSGDKHARLFKQPCALSSFIHCGGSCRYPGGCNNKSPLEPNLNFRVDSLPATLYCKLWKTRPQNVNQPADFVFIIQLQ